MSDSTGGFVIDTPEGIRAYGLLQVAHMLALEINTGLRHSRGSTADTARSLCGSTKRVKVAVLADYCDWLPSQVDGWAPSASIARALSR